jgi:hypothetical protein
LWGLCPAIKHSVSLSANDLITGQDNSAIHPRFQAQ